MIFRFRSDFSLPFHTHVVVAPFLCQVRHMAYKKKSKRQYNPAKFQVKFVGEIKRLCITVDQRLCRILNSKKRQKSVQVHGLKQKRWFRGNWTQGR